jgi:hypothetical protein
MPTDIENVYSWEETGNRRDCPEADIEGAMIQLRKIAK